VWRCREIQGSKHATTFSRRERELYFSGREREKGLVGREKDGFNSGKSGVVGKEIFLKIFFLG
jgi:hypothetical protein